MLTNGINQEPYTTAQKAWGAFTNREECAITIKSILASVRLALTGSPQLDAEETADLCWLLSLGETLAEIETYRGDAEEAPGVAGGN